MKRQKKIGAALILLSIIWGVIATILIGDATTALPVLVLGFYFMITKEEIEI